MIYLRFPSSQDEMVQYAEIKKPNYSGVLETALKEWYTDSLAQKYSKILGDSLYEVMNFPQDGIYYVNPETQTFFFFSKKSNLWVDTKKKVEDYVICPTDKIWERIFATNKFLKKAEELIKSTVEKETKTMFDTDTWKCINSFDLATGKGFSKNLSQQFFYIFKNYFSYNLAKLFSEAVMENLFPSISRGYVFLFENTTFKRVLTSEGTISVNEQAIESIEKSLQEYLPENDLQECINRLKNMLRFSDSHKYPISFMENGAYVIKHNGLDLITDDFESFYIRKITKEMVEAIVAVCKRDGESYHPSWRGDNYGLLLPSKLEVFGLNIPYVSSLYFNYCELYIMEENGEQHMETLFLVTGNKKLDIYYKNFVGKHLLVDII